MYIFSEQFDISFLILDILLTKVRRYVLINYLFILVYNEI
jgi:hypothetical protein